MNRMFPHSERQLFWILDDQNQPVVPTDYLEYIQWMAANPDRLRIGHDEVMDLEISTIFMGLAHPSHLMLLNDEHEAPFLFETMVFGPPEKLTLLHQNTTEDISSIFAKIGLGNHVQVRYQTHAEAVDGHTRMVIYVKKTLESQN